jgi:putative SOS response-associated peptidase YedK
MCGRYTLTKQDGVIEDLQASLGLTAQHAWWKPRFNIAPTQPAPVAIVRDGVRVIEMMRWGLVPHWAGKTGKRPPLMINARVETLQSRPVFRDAFERKRCLVPADGFFEWRREGKVPLPQYIHPVPRRVVAFAGIWTRAGDVTSFAIITSRPHPLVAPIHDRMPIVLPHEAYDAWLDPDPARARELLGVPGEAAMHGWLVEPVSSWVNKADHDDPTCIEPAAAPAQRSLF